MSLRSSVAALEPMSDRFRSSNDASKSSTLIFIANIWLAAVIAGFLFLRIFESRTAAHFLHGFSLR
jgi:hypothetical protein